MKEIPPHLKGPAILHDPLLNKGTAFTLEEREKLGIRGLLPPVVSTIEDQVARRYLNFAGRTNDLAKYLFLTALQDRNETLFYRLVLEHVEEMLPYIYTPTVGEASLQYSNILKKTRGVYFSYPNAEHIDSIVRNIPRKDIDVIVITDGERILGLGDLGVGGMVIPIGKLSLYTLFGGIHPARCLPVCIDVGTNNASLLDDPLYLGWQKQRIQGEPYLDFVDKVVRALHQRFPDALIQWEDFAKANARPLLEKYRHEFLSFNDDIQGTAAVALAAMLSGVSALGEKLTEKNTVIFGGGSAGMGIAHLIKEALVEQGLSTDEADKRLFIVDREGLVGNKMPFLEVIKKYKPGVLIGVSGAAGAFTKEVVQTMASGCKTPIILPLSNPTSCVEARPKDLIEWTRGNVILATGSPFAPVGDRPIGQCNNVYIFPGVGLGAITARSKSIPDRYFIKAAEILARHSPLKKDLQATPFPPLTELRAISAKIAAEIVRIEQGTPGEPFIDKAMWFPRYPAY